MTPSKLKVTAIAVVTCAVCAAAAAAASSPTVTTGAAKHVTGSAATLLGTINPGGASTAYAFRFGFTKTYGETTPGRSLKPGTRAVSVQAGISNLLPGTVYHYQLLAYNKTGAAFGADRTFRTAGNPPPGVATGPAGKVGKTTSTLTGLIATHGQATSYHFRYGVTQYSSQTPAATVPGSAATVAIDQSLQGLRPGTIFHYQLVATNRGVTEYGVDRTFMTLPRHPARARLRGRTLPHHARRGPFVFTTSGRLRGPRRIPGQFACAGSVTVQFTLGHRVLRRLVAPVQSDCRFSGQTRFARRPGRRHRRVVLRVSLRYSGDGYLAATTAHSERVSLG